MNESVERPQAGKGKISSKEEFELCYLRHRYLRRTTENPDLDSMMPYFKIIGHISRKTFFTYQNLMISVGFEIEDLESICQTHLVSYLGLFAIEKQRAELAEFRRIFKAKHGRYPKKEDLLNKNKAHFTMFLKQRMEDHVRICRQKGRNIKGYPTEEYYVYYGNKEPPEITRNLIKDCEYYGYRKLDVAIFKSIRKRAKLIDEKIFKFGRTWYVCVPVEQKQLTLDELAGADMSPHDNIHNMDPEQIFFHNGEEERWEKNQRDFDSLSKRKKLSKIRTFINKYKDDPGYKEEVRTARKLLKSMEL